MNLGIVILNWNGEKLLRQFLPSLIKFTPIKHNIYIIDNGLMIILLALLKITTRG